MADHDNTHTASGEEKPQNKAEEVARWLDKVSSSRKWREQISKDHRWKELIHEYKGHFSQIQNALDINILPINLIFAYVKTEIPSLYIRDPHIKINAKNKTSVKTAKVLEAIINYIWKYKKLKREIKKCILDCLLVGHGWLKTGYTGEFGTIEDGDGGITETIESEDFFAYYVPWENILFNKDALDPPHDAEWISQDVWVDLETVKKNPKYKNTDKLNTGITREDLDSTGSFDHQADRHKGKVLLHEVWNMKKKEVFTISDGVDDYIEDPKPWPYKMRGFPFSFLKFNFSTDEPYGLSDVGMFEPQVLEAIKVRSSELDHLKRYNRILATTPTNINDDEMAKLTKGVTGSIIKMENPDLLKPIPYPPLPQDVYAIEERIKDDLVNVSGQTPVERGASQKTSTRTIGELSLMQEGAKNRRSEKIDLVEDFVEDVSANLIALMQQFISEPYYVRILGVNSPELQEAVQERSSNQQQNAVTNEQGFTFTSEDIEGEYDQEPVSGSSTPIDRPEKMKAIMQLLELAPKAGVMPGGPFMGALAKELIELLGMPVLELALEAEQKAQAQDKKQKAEQQEELKQLQLTQIASDQQMDAENAATKKDKVTVSFLDTMIKAKQQKAK